jgi:hypothetical protein
VNVRGGPNHRRESEEIEDGTHEASDALATDKTLGARHALHLRDVSISDISIPDTYASDLA